MVWNGQRATFFSSDIRVLWRIRRLHGCLFLELKNRHPWPASAASSGICLRKLTDRESEELTITIKKSR